MTITQELKLLKTSYSYVHVKLCLKDRGTVKIV